MLKGLNKLQIKARLTRAFIMVAGILATVAVIILVTMVVMSKIYAGTLVDYGFAQGNVGRAMSQLADSRSAMRGIIGYDNQDTINTLLQDRKEYKENFAKDMVTGFIKLNGMTIGCVANRTEVYSAEGEVTDKFDAVLSADGCEKAADFINFCDAFDIPVLSLTNVKGYEATVCSEKRIAKAVAKLTYAFANATVPKVNVVIGKALGSAYVAMNSKAIGADLTIAWPDAEIGSMDAALAAKIMYEGQGADVIKEKAAEYAALQTSATGAARRGYVDQIIEAADTRKYVIGAFEMLFTKREDRPSKKHGTV